MLKIMTKVDDNYYLIMRNEELIMRIAKKSNSLSAITSYFSNEKFEII